jgi:predicted ATPase
VEHYATKLKRENKALNEALDFLQFQMRVIVQSRFDKYVNAKDSESTMAYRKAVGEIDLRLQNANETVQEILDRELGWDGRGFYPID